MTRVLVPAEQAEVTAAEQERLREAWNPPRQPMSARTYISPDAQEDALPEELAIRPPWTIGPARDINRTQNYTPDHGLDWEGFSAAYFPGSRRHDLKAITAYGAYKRSGVVEERSATEASRRREADRSSTRTSAVESWEDEGGASL